MEASDTIINAFYQNLYSEQGGELPLPDGMTAAERAQFAQKEAELSAEPELQHLDEVVHQQTNVLATNGVNGHDGVNSMNGETAAT